MLYQVIWVPSNTARPTLEGEHSCLPHCSQEEVFPLSLPPRHGLLAVCLQNVYLQMSPGTLSLYQVCIHHLSHLHD